MKAFAIGMLLLLQQSVPSGSIVGRVVPEYTGLGISLSRYTYDDNGELKLDVFKVARTSLVIGEFGEFRFEDVEPGEYYIHTDPFGVSAGKGEGLPLTYYPGAPDVGTAARIIVKAGEEVRLGDLNLFPVLTPTIRLRLVDATGDSDLDKSCVNFSWKRRGTPGVEKLQQSLIRCGVDAIDKTPLPALPPGTYDVYAGWTGKDFRATPVHGAATTFEIRNLDFEIEIVVSRPRVTGKIVIEDSDGSLRPAAGIQISLVPKRVGPDLSVETAVDGSFRLDSVGQNDYMIHFPDLPANAYVARLKDEDRDVLKDGLEVRSGDIHLEGVISFAGGTLEGTVQPGAIVALVPDLPFRTNYLYRAATAENDGTFTIRRSPQLLIDCSRGRS